MGPVEKRRANRIFTNGANAVDEQKPALVQLDRSAAGSDLDELSGKLWFEDRRAAIPGEQGARVDQVEILVVQLPDHRVAAADLAREKTHSLVAAAAPLSGVIRKDRKSVVSRSSERIAPPLYAV
jgi:hypothetical protein